MLPGIEALFLSGARTLSSFRGTQTCHVSEDEKLSAPSSDTGLLGQGLPQAPEAALKSSSWEYMFALNCS